MVCRKGEACSRDRERASPLLYSNYNIGSELVAGEPGDAVKALLQVGIGGDVVAHLAIVELLVGHHVKVAGAGQAKDDGLFLAGLLALEGLVDGGADGVAALGGGQDALDAGKLLGGFKHSGLLHAAGFHQAVVVELAQDAAHAVVAQTACMVGTGDEAGAQGVHLGQRADHASVAEVVDELAAGEAGAAGGFHGNDTVVGFAPELLAHKGADQAAQVAAAARAADDDIGLDTDFIQRGLGLQTDDALVEQHLIQHAAQHIAVTGSAGGDLHSLADGAAQAAGGVRVLGQDLAAHVGGHAGAGGHRGTVGAHDLAAEGLLLIADLDHVHLAVQPEITAGHGKGSAPLACARLGGHALQALLFGVVGLSDGAVQLVTAAGVVALELVVDPGRGAQSFFQPVGTAQGARAVHPVVFPDLIGDGNIGGGVVQLLLYQLVAEHAIQLLGGHGLQGVGVQQRSGFVLHIGPHIVPCSGQLCFVEVDLVRDVCFGFHGLPVLSGHFALAAGQEIKNAPVPKHIRALGQER